MQVDKIYFDMDGVLADFDEGVRRLCGWEPVGQGKISEEEDRKLFEGVRKAGHFYRKLIQIPGMKELVKELYDRYGSRCAVLSKVPRPSYHVDEAAEDKFEWIKREFPCLEQVEIVQRKEKEPDAAGTAENNAAAAEKTKTDGKVHTGKTKADFCTGQNCILIDDYRKNIDEWNKAGGTGILFKDAESLWQQLQKLGIL